MELLGELPNVREPKEKKHRKEKEKKPEVRLGRNFYVHLEDKPNYKLILKVGAPSFTLYTEDENCEICQLVKAFMSENGFGKMTVQKLKPRPKPAKEEKDDDVEMTDADEQQTRQLREKPKKKKEEKNKEPEEYVIPCHEIMYHEIPIDVRYGKKPYQALRKEFLAKNEFVKLPHQANWFERFKNANWRQKQPKPFGIHWTVGSGKTLGFWLPIHSNPPERVIIVTTNTTLDQWASYLHKLSQETGETRYELVGYQEFAKRVAENPNYCVGAVVAVDECQRFRNMQTAMLPSMAAMRKANWLFLISATFLVNDPDETRYLNYFWTGNVETLSPQQLYEVMKGTIDFFDPRIHAPKFFRSVYPRVEYKTFKIPMGWFQTCCYVLSLGSNVKLGNWTYKSATRNSYHAFSKKFAMVVDGEDTSPKIEKISDEIVNDQRYPQVVHSHLLDSGLDIVAKSVRAKKPALRTAEVTGATPNDDRFKIFTKFNDGELDVLFISDASAIGVDLLNAVVFHMTALCDNEESEKQLIGRILRLFCSHDPQNTTVTIKKYISTFPTGPIPESELNDIKAYYEDTLRFNKKPPAGYDFIAELKKKVQELKYTVDEMTEMSNQEKAKALQPYIEAIHKAAMKPLIPMVDEAAAPRKEKKKKKKDKEEPEPHASPTKPKKEKQMVVNSLGEIEFI